VYAGRRDDGEANKYPAQTATLVISSKENDRYIVTNAKTVHSF